MNRILPVAAGIAVLVGGAFAWQNLNSHSSNQVISFAEAQEAAEAGDIDTSRVVEMMLGDPDAPVTIIEYASSTCPHCQAFHQDTFKEFKSNYIDTGKVHFIYREVYFDFAAVWAAAVARCDETKFFGIMDMVFDDQRGWIGDGAQETIRGNLEKFGLLAGIPKEDVNACLDDRDFHQALIAVYRENAERDGVREGHG